MTPIKFASAEEAVRYQQLLAECQGQEQTAWLRWHTAKELAHGKQGFAWFCRNVLGYEQMLQDHWELCDWIQKHLGRPKLILMPRYSFKSSLATIGYSLWCLLRDPNERILLYSDTTEKAQGFLSEIKHHILGQAKGGGFRCLTNQQTWEVDPQTQTWNQSAIVIKARTQASREPSVDTAGIETSKVGMHYDRIIFDDIVSDKNVTTKEQMDKVWECYTKSLSLLKPGGDVMMLGTRWHFGDLYGRLMAENDQTGQWAVCLRKAEEQGRYPFASIGLTQEFLLNKKAAQGTRIFSALYQNDPTDDETATFKARDFTFYAPAKTEAFRQWVSQLYITCVLDPIPPPTSDHGDDAAITVVGTDEHHAMYLLEAVAGRFSPEQQIEEVLALHAAWRFRKFGLETNAFQRMLRSTLELRLRERRRDPRWQPFSIVEFNGITQGNKEQRIQGLQPWHEQGMLKFPGEKLELLQGVWSQLAYQMIQFPHSQKDDLCFVAGTRIATLSGEKLIERIKPGELVITPTGIRRVLISGSTGQREILTRWQLTGTPEHPVFVYGQGLTPLDTLAYTMQVSRLTYQEVLAWKYQRLLNLMVSSTIAWEGKNSIISATPQNRRIGSILKDFMWRCGNFIISGQFRRAVKFTTRMGTLLITHQAIWSVFQLGNIGRCLSDWTWRKCEQIWIEFVRLPRFGMLLQKVYQEPVSRPQVEKAVDGTSRFSAPNVVGRSSRTNIDPLKPALVPVEENTPARTAEVFNLAVEHDGLYYANGVLVSNCDSLAYHLQLKQPGFVTPHVVDPPYTSAAWFEREQRKEELKVLARRPRWHRKPLPALSFS